MTKLRNSLVCLLLISLLCASCALAKVLFHVDAELTDLHAQELVLAERVLGHDGILDGIEDEQVQLRDVTRSARITVDEVGQASIEERHYFEIELPELTGDVADTLRSTRAAVAELPPAVTEIHDAIAGVLPIEAETTQTVRDLDARISSPEVTQILDSGAAAAAQSAQTAANLDRSTADVANEVHGFLHPRWPHRLVHALRSVF